jgi:nitric oxide dioxygenase
MDSRQKELIKATVPTLQTAGALLTGHFYNRMFTHNPELKEVFNMGNQANGRQREALAGAVLAYAEHIDNPGVLINVLKGIGHKHTSLNIEPAQYDIVGRHLIASISEVLGDAATPELLEAWTVAYNELAAIMIGLEKEMYDENEVKPGAWKGWRKFIIKKIVKESEEIKSFYLYPEDNGGIADFHPGQFISVQTFVEQLGLMQPRQYSLSGSNNGSYYRISVKKENAVKENPAGMVSNTLHGKKEGDSVMLSAPAGTFRLRDTEGPIVLISGGVGLTPMLSMLEANRDKEVSNKAIWIHGCRNTAVQAFKNDIETLKNETDWLETYTFIEDMEHHQTSGTLLKGRVDLNHLEDAVLPKDAHYYICGPAQFIRTHYEHLAGLAINKENIFYEEFGPQSLSLN